MKITYLGEAVFKNIDTLKKTWTNDIVPMI